MGAAPQRELSAVLRELEEAAPRLYSRWSAKAWRLVCQGPATRLWDALAESPAGVAALTDYLYLARESIGMQYLAATRPEDLQPGAPAHGFLAVMLCETLPRLLPQASAKERVVALAQIWNVGEKLVGKPVWLDRYLAARLPELKTLGGFEEFLVRIVSESLDERPKSSWQGATSVSSVDPSVFDRAFLPGTMHLATPLVLCVHDRRREGRQVAVLLRQGKPVCLGATPCLGHGADIAGGAPQKFTLRALSATGLPGALHVASAPSGFAIFATDLSQRLWLVESEK